MSLQGYIDAVTVCNVQVLPQTHAGVQVPREGVCGSDVDEVLVVQLVVLSEEVHVGRDLRGPCSLHDQSEVGG